MVRFFSALMMSLLSVLPVNAQVDETPAAILVLDASGSMWGQIDGINKIVIAREVIGEMLGNLPQNQALGLTVYGHRRRGDCADIETLIEPGLDTRAAIAQAVNTINPRGRTPMTAAVVEAARALSHTENAATVILVSDGIETCEADPCAIAAALEASGVDFTAHVIGFDVADPEARAQMQCIAGNTGGQFLTADNAEELALALEQVAAAPPPEPSLVEMTFTARIGSENGTLITDPVEWDIRPETGESPMSGEGNGLRLEMEDGAYTATAYWSVQETEASTRFVITGTGREITVVFEQPLPEASLMAPDEAVAGAMIEVEWTGPGDDGDSIVAGHPGERTYANYEVVREGNPLPLRMPSQPGEYELRYLMDDDRTVIATRMITVIPAIATLEAPETAAAGSEIEVIWTGPDYRSDFISVAEPGARIQINYALTRDGSPAILEMPVETGTYELRYVIHQDSEVIASQMIEVTDVTASLSAPASAIVGSEIEVSWTGPGYDNDYIGIGRMGEDGPGAWETYSYTRDGDPMTIQIPSTPGDYAITYFLGQDRVALASTALTVMAAEATLSAPPSAVAGETIEVTWTGPGYENDYVGIGAVGASGSGAWENYAYTRDGEVLELLMPVAPGAYEITYFLGQGREVLHTVPITLSPVSATLEAPESAAAGGSVEVTWAGPDYDGDFIGIGPADADDNDRWQGYAYTRDGNTVSITLPDTPGDYAIRYILGQGRSTLVSRPLRID